ncbi:hypothetical protein LX64_00289 [Chitinophaga skermanii]|uniref:Uncharacterized protein n=1 Tax=Chitinophaga skermanii TaxID=331697 RepID=A0A327R4M6_9BACT|nr:hypothetical protein [Chitinophaga skermanii]RAJ10683.1 hypothetical protein LX64_00289 [Chitinophaga skermanii]
MGKLVHMPFKQLERVSFYPTKNGFITTTPYRKPTNWDAEQYEKIRSHRKEFGRAAQVAADIRFGFKETMELFPDSTMYRRLSTELLKVIKSDTTHIRGERTVEDGRIDMLMGFEFNKDVHFKRTFNTPYQVAIDRTKGTATVDIPAFSPANRLRAHKHATHYKLMLTVHAINFDTNEMDSVSTTTTTMAIAKQTNEGITLTAKFQQQEHRHIFVSLGVIFIEMLQGRAYDIRGKHCNAMSIIAVSEKQAVMPSVQEKKETRAVIIPAVQMLLSQRAAAMRVNEKGALTPPPPCWNRKAKGKKRTSIIPPKPRVSTSSQPARE